MNNPAVNLGLHINPSNNLPSDTFAIAESKRYAKLQNAPQECGPRYASLNFNGITMKEILGYPA